MSSSQDGKMNSDAEMVEAPLAPVDGSAPEPTCVAGFLSFRERMALHKAEKEITQTTEEKSSSPAATDAPVSGSEVPVLPEVGECSETQSLGAPSQVPGSLSVPINLEDKEEAVEPVPPAKKEIVQGLRAASAVPISRSRKRKCVAPVEGGPPLPEGLRIAPVLRGKVCCSDFNLSLHFDFMLINTAFLPAFHISDRRDDWGLQYRGCSSCQGAS
ncbi:Uncharacterized protein Rs2_18626 [Raphanus sativus]|nr:Uncharacterized protein Rs2_18626 [Raphanus sativus]